MAKDWKGFERTVAKSLGAWWGCIMRRTPGSGAWGKQGQSRFNRKSLDATSEFHGDVCAPEKSGFPFSVECKCYKTVGLYLFLYGKSEVLEWWKQCRQDARRHKKLPMLVFKENMKRPLVAIDALSYTKLYRIKKLKQLRVMNLTYNTNKGLRTIVIMDFHSFLEAVPKKYIQMFLP